MVQKKKRDNMLNNSSQELLIDCTCFDRNYLKIWCITFTTLFVLLFLFFLYIYLIGNFHLLAKLM